MFSVRKIRKLFRKLGISIFGASLCFIFLYFVIWTYLPRKFSERELKPCVLEKLDPWDKSLTEYLVSPPPLQCSNKHKLLYVDEGGVLKFNESAIKLYKFNNKQLKCTTRAMNRVLGDQYVRFDTEIDVNPPTFVKSHVFRVTCITENQTTIYDYLHFNPQWNSDTKPMSDISNEGTEKLSLIIFGIDSVSRSHALRFLPKSYKFLQEEFHMYDFEGYSKVGENTWPNLVPLLTGKSHRDFPGVSHLRMHADSMPLIWNEKPMKQMATFFAEDRPDISTFNFVKSGFKHQPTDYFFRPYTLGMNEFEAKILEHLGKPSFNCYGVDNYFDIQIEYLKGFLTRYSGKRKFAYFWNNQVCHEDFTTLSRGDDSFHNFLKWMNVTGQTKNSVFLVLSDHGFRIGGASLTHAGRAENNKPWLMVHIPKTLRRKYPWLHRTLLENSKKLVTHYDIYKTMLDITNDRTFEHIPDIQPYLVRRNIFAPIPNLRTCADAGIEEKYCTCKEKLAISTTSDLVQSIANFLVEGINSILSKQQDLCYNLYLSDITEASVSYSNSDEDNLTKEQKEKQTTWWQSWGSHEQEPDTTGRYYILFHTKPGNAYFEGTVDFTKYLYRANKHMTMIGEPSRLDRYGNQSYCVDDSFLRLFCYCKGYRPETVL